MRPRAAPWRRDDPDDAWDLIAAPADALVNPVNCVGVMGRGLALAFMLVVERDGRPRWIVAFPTKRHFRHPSKLEWIVAGLADLRRVVVERDMASIAVPALGCGLGGLDWALVRPMIVEALVDLVGREVLLYEPDAG